MCLIGSGEDRQSDLSVYYTAVKPILSSRSKRKDLCGHILQLPAGLFFHVGEHFTLSVSREDASIEGRGHPPVDGGLDERKSQYRMKLGVAVCLLEL